MCNLNVLITRKKFSESDIDAFNGATATSYASNSDGCGVLFSRTNRVLKSYEFIDLHKYRAEFLNSKAIISHQRIATKGYSKDSLQPFAYDRFSLIHNGILRSEVYNSYEGKSDSYGFFQEFLNKVYKKGVVLDDKYIAGVLKDMLKEEDGYYSIFIWDRRTNQGWYAKNPTASISFKLYKNKLFITTKETNEVFFNNKSKDVKIQDYVVYRIKSDLSIDKMCDIPHTEKYVQTYNYHKRYSDDPRVWGYDEDEFEKLDKIGEDAEKEYDKEYTQKNLGVFD